MLQYQVGRRCPPSDNAIRRRELCAKADAKCQQCGADTPLKEGVRHHAQMLSEGGTDFPNNEQWLCKKCHKKVHPWLKKVL